MPARPHRRSFAAPALAAALMAGVGALPGPAGASPTVGFVEHWDNGTTNGWAGGDTYSSPTSGGQRGAGDGYLQITTPGPAPFFSTNLGSSNTGPAYAGNWQVAGITKVQFWLDDVGTPDPLEIHFAIGTSSNFWQYDTGFIPPAGSWAQFSVDVSTSTGWTHIIDSPPGNTFDAALQGVTRVLIRHDHAPYVQNPDTIRATVGVDELTLLNNASTAVAPPPPGVRLPVELAPPYPNPANGTAHLALRTFDSEPVRIEVVDAQGRLIRSEWLEQASAGPRSWVWDGRTSSGAAAPAGYYRVRAFSSSGGTSRPVVLLAGAR